MILLLRLKIPYKHILILLPVLLVLQFVGAGVYGYKKIQSKKAFKALLADITLEIQDALSDIMIQDQEVHC